MLLCPKKINSNENSGPSSANGELDLANITRVSRQLAELIVGLNAAKYRPIRHIGLINIPKKSVCYLHS